MNRHIVVAVISAAAGAVALGLTVVAGDDPVSLGTALGVVLLANAAVRLGMARQ